MSSRIERNGGAYFYTAGIQSRKASNSSHEMYSVNQSYSYGLRRYVVGAYTSYTVSASATQFDHNFAGDGVYFGYKAYFFIDGTSPGATVSIYGTMETY